jgi:hypothetical protein
MHNKIQLFIRYISSVPSTQRLGTGNTEALNNERKLMQHRETTEERHVCVFCLRAQALIYIKENRFFDNN